MKRVDHGYGNRAERAGFTFVELMVGVALLAILITALAGSSIYSSKTMTRATSRLNTVHFLQTELEDLLNVPYDSVVSGSRTTSVGLSRWVVRDSLSFKKIFLEVAYSPVGGDSIRDTVVTFRKAPR